MPVKASANYDPVERRIRAAMILAGLDFKGLAKRIDAVNLRESTLRRLNESEPKATRIHLRAIAEACGVPYEFFTVPLAELGRPAASEAGTNGVDGLREELRQLAQTVAALQADVTILGAEGHLRTAEAEQPTLGRRRPGSQR